jgi:hypothetical protein
VPHDVFDRMSSAANRNDYALNTKFSFTMLIAEHCSGFPVGIPPKRGLPEIHRSKISLHRAKIGYDYPTIRLPHTFLPACPLEFIRLFLTDH